MTEPTPEPSGIKRIVGLILITIGVIWIAGAGLCTAGFFVTLFFESRPDAGEIMSIVPMVLIVGGFSIGLGFVFYVVGRALRPKT